MKANFKWIYALFVVLSVQLSFAQEKTVTGTVTEAGQPLPGVTVIVKGSNVGTQTDFDGRYSIRANVGATLEFTYIGMKTQNIQVGASNVINVAMVEDALELEGVVLVQEGYRTVTKARSASAVSVVSSETLEARPNASVLQTLQGQVAGFNITTGSGQPGAVSSTLIRGVASVNGNTEPLYVIDGVPQSGSSFRALNPEDVENITVLKDAAAVAQYGNRGSNGVVVVTTRRGKAGYSSVAITSTTGFSDLQPDRYRLMNSQQILEMERRKGQLLNINAGFGSTLTPEQIAAYDVNTDWRDELLRRGSNRMVNLAINGGGENVRAFTSINFTEQEGLNAMSRFHRLSVRNNLDGKAMNDKLTYSSSIALSYVRDFRVPALGTGGVNTNPQLAALRGLPYLSPSDYVNGAQLNELVRGRDPGRFGGNVPLLGFTPLMILDLQRNREFRFNEFQIFASNTMQYEITKDLSVRNTFGIDYTQFTVTTAGGPEGFNAIFFAENQGMPFGGFQSNQYSHDAQMTNTFSINYNKVFKEKHSIDLGLYSEFTYGQLRSFDYSTNGLNPITYFPGSGQGYVPEDPDNFAWYRRFVDSNISYAFLFSNFAIADYDYDNKFGFTATIRRDASYRFRGNNMHAVFPSVAGRVNLDKFSFMEGSSFDMLKIRASIGTAGNQNLAGQSLYALPNFFRDQYFLSGPGGYLAQQGAIPQLGNADLRWERTLSANIGVDLSFKRRLRANFDVYQRTTNDLFLPIIISAAAGQTGINGNFGSIRNRGAELNVNYDLLVPAAPDGLKINVWANGSANFNKFTDLPPDATRVPLGNTIRFLGGQVDEFFVFQHAGINPLTGNHLFHTADGQLTETPDEADRRATGLSRVPIYQGGFGFNIDYKNFYMSTQFTFVADVTRFDFDMASLSDPNNIGQFNLTRDLLNHWTPDNQFTGQPSLNVANQGFASNSNRFLVDASYLRIRNLQFGYNFPKKMFNDAASLKVFVQGENVFTWSKWRGWDPESPRTGDQAQFPTPRIFTVGAQINL